MLSEEVTIQAAHASSLTLSVGFFRCTGGPNQVSYAVLNFGRASEWQCNAGHTSCIQAEDKKLMYLHTSFKTYKNNTKKGH